MHASLFFSHRKPDGNPFNLILFLISYTYKLIYFGTKPAEKIKVANTGGMVYGRCELYMGHRPYILNINRFIALIEYPNKTNHNLITFFNYHHLDKGVKMKNRHFLLTISVAMVMIWITGCSSFPGIKKTSSPTKTTKKGLYTSVPVSMRAPVKEANFDLKQAESNLKLAQEQVKLAEFKKERGILEKKRADLNQELAETLVEKAKVTIERKKLEAIDNANLGDKASNIKKIANLKTKELSIESKAVNTKASIATLDLEIKKLNKKVNLQARKVDSSRK